LEESQPNPYAAPADVLADGSSTTVERIHFEGAVSPLTLQGSLRTRFSWVGISFLGIGSLICFMFSPESFLNPWNTRGLMFVDAVGEQLGLVGLGLIAIAFWQLYSAYSGKSIEAREKYLLRHSPTMYSQPKRGWFDEQCIFIHEGGVDSWIAWDGVGQYQQGQELLLIDWGPGIGGTTALTADMFDSTVGYRQAGQLLRKHTPHGFHLHRLGDLKPHFDVSGLLPQSPPATDIIAKSEHTTTYREAYRTISRKMPNEILSHGRHVHRFFVFMGVLALVFVQRWWISFFLLLALWVTIFGLGIVISYFQLTRLLHRSDDRLLTTKTQFTADAVHVHSTVAYSRIPLDGLTVVEVHDDKLVLRHRDASSNSELLRDDFASASDWIAACELFAANSSTAT